MHLPEVSLLLGSGPITAQGLELALTCTGGHLLAPPFSEDSCERDQRCLLPMLSILVYKITSIYLLGINGLIQGIYCATTPLKHGI